MSLINKMLKELDRRHAGQPDASAEPGAEGMLQNVRPVKRAALGSEMFWWLLAVMMLAMVAWLGWVMWQLMPKPIVTERALLAAAHPARGTETSAANASAPVVAGAGAGAVATSTPSSAAPAAAVAQGSTPQSPAAPQESAAAAPARGDSFKLATEITTPIPERRGQRPGRIAGEGRQVLALASPRPAAPPAPTVSPPLKAVPSTSDTLPKAARTLETSPPAAPRPPATAAPQPQPRIDRQASGNTANVAETLYRRAVGFINQGRISEGMEELRGALVADGRHEAARQTLVALLLEQKRSDEAAGILQQGIELNPANAGFVMLLARIMVERQDVPGALALLKKHAAAAIAYPDYRAFEAALLQRQGQHKEAAEEYAAALRISPQNGVWWVGLGISQEALDRKADALESFQRARQTRTLNTEVAAYAEQRVRQLQ